ncbi:MAG: GIY-YIG nuclease family protein [Bacteroidales bacterium]|nr:GIY-YIG nuclease family protein [Bacteroidales bacterium]
MYNTYYVYMMSSNSNKALYIGVTNDLIRRVREHKDGTYGGFTLKYSCSKLVYYESYSDISQAIDREKQLKGWKRCRKDEMIDNVNPERRDLYDDLI